LVRVMWLLVLTAVDWQRLKVSKHNTLIINTNTEVKKTMGEEEAE
jgi:hypothetical protein